MDAPVEYRPLMARVQADTAFAILDAELPWGRHDLPRDEVYFNDHMVPYTYGAPGRARTYWPEDKWHPIVAAIRIGVEEMLMRIDSSYDIPMDVCFLNRYVGPRDQLGWHADDSPEMNPEACIVTVSLGAEREIMFRRNAEEHLRWLVEQRKVVHEDRVPERLLLAHGSAAAMLPGMQQKWQHRIPKSSQSDIGTRISLTFRGYLPEVSGG